MWNPNLEPAARDRALGALLGLAVGDALGTTNEFLQRGTFVPVTGMVGGGHFRLKPGQWTDDTSMALCLVDSLNAQPDLDPHDLAQRFWRWWRQGENSVTGRCFDIGNATRDALQRFEQTGDPMAGSTNPRVAGNGSLMRLSPIAIRFRAPNTACNRAKVQSEVTHGAAECVDACSHFVTLLHLAIGGASKAEVLAPSDGFLGAPAIAAIAAGAWRGKKSAQIRSSGYVVDTLEAAIWCVDQGADFREAVLLAANLGDDADTVAAVTGQLAGALWGLSAIPPEWLDVLAWRDDIVQRGTQLWEKGLAELV